MEKLICTYLKNAENTTHKIRLPLKIVQKFGLAYYMEVYEDHIVLKPVGFKNGQNTNRH